MPETKGAEYESVESCSLCSGKESELLFYSRDLRFGLPGDFPVVRCQRCKLIRLGKRPKRESMQSYYPTDYPAYLAEKPDERTWKSLFRNWITNHLLRSQYDGQIAQLHASNASLRILDVGCGAGQALDFYKRFGWNASAVEPSEIAAQRATEHGHAVFCDVGCTEAFLDQDVSSSWPHGYFNGICQFLYTLVKAVSCFV